MVASGGGGSTGTASQLTWHVETSGNDTTGDGSVGNPFATPMGAIRALKTLSGGLIHHVVQILLGTGNFPGFDLANFIVEPLDDGTTPASLLVSGTLTTFTPPSGSGTGTLTSVTAGSTATGTWTVWSDSTQNWPVNGLVGYFVEILTGTGAGNVFPILSNTATDLTIPSSAAISATGATYTIRDCSSVITTAIQMPGAVVGQNSPTPQSAVTQNVGFAVRDIGGATNGTTWARVEQLKVNLGSPSSAFLDCHVSNPRGVTVTRCHFTTAQGTRASFFGPGYATFSNNILTSTTPNISLSSAAGFGALHAPGLSVNGNHFRYRLSGAFALSVGGGSMLITNNQFDGDVVMSIGGPPGGYQFAGINKSPAKYNANFGIRARSVSNGPAGHVIHVTGWLEMGGSGASSAIWLVGPHSIIVDGTLVGSNNLVALDLARGARAQISAASTITGTTEVSLDGVATTLANMRAQSPKVLTNSYGTTIYE